MSNAVLAEKVASVLRNQLAEMKEGKNELLNKYFPELSSERNKAEELFTSYQEEITRLLKKTEKTKKFQVPFVTIDSEVEIEDLADGGEFTYRIVSPSRRSFKNGEISFLSPVGRFLLLRKPGDEVEVQAPGGTFRYRIKKVRLREDILQK